MQVSKQEAKEIIDEYFDEERLTHIVLETSIVAWKHVVQRQNIQLWLNNFTGKYFDDVSYERKVALWLLAHFTYYTYEDIRVLCKELFYQYLHYKLVETMDTIDNLKESINEIVHNSLFVGLGNEGESGNNILYYFRQENDLPNRNFTKSSKKYYKNVVYIDDITISGSQARRYIGGQIIDAENIYVATLIASNSAKEEIVKSDERIRTISTIMLDSRDQAFSSENHLFSDEKVSLIKPIVKEFCEEYGRLAIEGYDDMKNSPLGFADGQYLIGFEYNTPNNTLPIFWGCGNNWKPIFKRNSKIYSGKEYAFDENRYY